MEEINDDKLLLDLISIHQKKRKIIETLAFTQKAHKVFLAGQKRARIRLWTISLAGIAAVFLIGLVALPSFIAMDGSSAYEQYHSKFNPDIATRGSGPQDRMTEVIVLYTDGHYKEAIALADTMLYSQSDNNKLLFFKGLTALEMNNDDQAAMLFKQVIPQGGPIEAYSRWYLALIYLRHDNFSACRDQLSGLKKIDGHPFRQKVSKLYRQLRFRRNP
jgi:hypothetical protein